MESLAADRDRTRLLAEEMTGLDFEALAREDAKQVRRLLLDQVVVAWRGTQTSWSRTLAGWAASRGDGNGCTVVGASVRAVPSIVALVNATAAPEEA